MATTVKKGSARPGAKKAIRKSPAKKAAPRKAAAKKAAKKAAPRKAAKKLAPRKAASKRPARKAAATKKTPSRAARAKRITPAKALANTRRLLEAKQAHDRETPTWQALEGGHASAAHPGFQDAQARDQANALHAAESDMDAIHGASGAGPA